MKKVIDDPQGWNDLVASLPDPQILQSWEWGEVKKQFGWQPSRYLWQAPGQATASVLQRTVTLAGIATPLRVLYVPKGPLLDWGQADLRQQVLADLQRLAHERNAIFIKIDPEIRSGPTAGEPGGQESDRMAASILVELTHRGWRFSQDQIQFRNTIMLDLSPSEASLLERMKSKARYNIRLAERKGVTIRRGDTSDYPLLYRMYAETSIRDGFAIRDEDYYQVVWKTFSEQGMAEPLIAEVDSQPVAALILFYFARKAWYLYGMSSALHREKMPNYLLQWEAIRRAKAKGCQVYDLWGAPETFTETDPLWGVYRFKTGLGGDVIQTIGAWDLPVRPLLYRLYTQILPRLLNIMRRRGFRQTRGALT